MLNNATLTSIESVSEVKPNLVNVTAKQILNADFTKVLKRGPYKSVKARTLQKC